MDKKLTNLRTRVLKVILSFWINQNSNCSHIFSVGAQQAVGALVRELETCIESTEADKKLSDNGSDRTFMTFSHILESLFESISKLDEESTADTQVCLSVRENLKFVLSWRLF